MERTPAGAPGHVAAATDRGWYCTCGAGTEWPNGETRERNRATGGARRHLTAAARNNPEYRAEIRDAVKDDAPEDTAEAPAETPEAPSEAQAEAQEAPAQDPPPMTYAERLRAAQDAATATRAEFRAP
jgi:hypothetical protein